MSPRNLILTIMVAALAAAFGTRAIALEHKPQRIVSLNLCADELVLQLADPGRVVSVTYLARDPRGSTVADLARGVPVNRGLAEEIVQLAPDLVIAGAFTTRTTVALLKRFGIPLMEVGVPATLAEADAQVRAVATRIGEPERGEEMIAARAARLATLPAPPAHPPTAVVVRPNGFTAGRGSLVDALLTRAGLDNLASRLSADRMGQLTVEEIVTARPDVLVTDAEPGAPPSLAQEMLRHPALARMNAVHVSVPGRLWACAGPEIAEAAERLAAGTPPRGAP